MPNYKLQVFKPYEVGDVSGKYRFAVIDPNNGFGYPANFVCMLPRKIYDKGKPLSVFAKMFGKDSVDYAVELLTEAIKRERDGQTRDELQKRLNSLASDNSSNLKPKKELVSETLTR